MNSPPPTPELHKVFVLFHLFGSCSHHVTQPDLVIYLDGNVVADRNPGTRAKTTAGD